MHKKCTVDGKLNWVLFSSLSLTVDGHPVPPSAFSLSLSTPAPEDEADRASFPASKWRSLDLVPPFAGRARISIWSSEDESAELKAYPDSLKILPLSLDSADLSLSKTAAPKPKVIPVADKEKELFAL